MMVDESDQENDSVEVKTGVVAVVWRADTFLLVQRGKEPNRGLWAFPGGSIHWGEPLITAAIRELGEETGVIADAPRVLAAFDAIATPAYHFVLIPVLMRWCAGEGIAGDDAAAVGWYRPEEIKDLSVVSTLWPVLADARAALGLSPRG